MIAGNPLLMLYESGLKGLYEGGTRDEHRLYQAAVLGFGGIFALFKNIVLAGMASASARNVISTAVSAETSILTNFILNDI